MRVKADGRRALLAVALGAMLLAGAANLARGAEAVVLGCASAADLKGLIAKVGKLAEKFAPGAGAQVQEMSTMLTQAPEWAGVDWSKPATVVLFGGKAFGKTEPVPVVLVTLADAAPFRQANPEGGRVSFEVRDNVAIVAQEKAALAAVTPERFALYSKFPKIAGNADVYITFYASQTIAEYQGEIEAGLKELEQQAGEMAMPGPMGNIAKVIKCIPPLVNLACKQVRRASLTLQFNEDSVDIWGRLYAAEDTELGTFLSGQPAEMTDLAKYLPAETVAAVTGKLDAQKLMPLVNAVLKAIAGPLELSAADQQKWRDLLFASTQTGEFASAIPAGAAFPGMQTVQVVRVADVAKFRSASKDAIEWVTKSGLGAFIEAAGVKMTVDHKPNAREYKGVTVDRITVTMAPVPGAPPNPMMGQQPPQVTEIAALNGLGVTAGNNPGGELLNGVLDRIKGGGTPGLDTSAAYKAAVAAAPKGADVVAIIHFNSLLAKFVEEMAKQQPAIAMMVGALVKADPTEEPITSYVSFGTNVAEMRTRIPHQPILTMVTRVRKMIEGQPGAKPGPKPKDQDDF